MFGAVFGRNLGNGLVHPMTMLSFSIIASMLALLACVRCKTVLVRSLLVATEAAIINFMFDFQSMKWPPSPKDILFYGVGNFLLAWILGFGISLLIGLIVGRLAKRTQ